MKKNPKQRLGQYFLRDRAVLNKIVSALELTSQDSVLEIGPGTGVLTVPIARLAGKVIAVELDKRLCEVLRQELRMAELANVEIIQQDFLRQDLSELPHQLKIVSNLPYYITTPIITKIIEAQINFTQMVLTMQQEVAQRIAAVPGNKIYGSITVFVQFYCDVEIVSVVYPRSFSPQPNVDSCIVKFSRRPPPPLTVPEAFLFQVVRRSFGNRRKMLKNTLAGFGDLSRVSIDLSRRPETLSLAEFCRLAEEIAHANNPEN